MNQAMGKAADAVNVKENPVKRTLAKLRHPMRAQAGSQVSDSTVEKPGSQGSTPKDGIHVTTSEYATSGSHAIIREVAKYLKGPEGEEALRQIFYWQAHIVYDFILEVFLCDELKVAARTAGREIIFGSAEGLESTLSARWKMLPKAFTMTIFMMIAIYVCLLLLGVLVALWRFALFGLDR